MPQDHPKQTRENSPSSAQEQRDRLFKAWFTIWQFQKREDFCSLQSKGFLKLCGLEWISWEPVEGALKLLPDPKPLREELVPAVVPPTDPSVVSSADSSVVSSADSSVVSSADSSPTPSLIPSLIPFSCPLKRENSFYGNLLFFSSQGFSKGKKTFCETIAFYSSCALYFIEKSEKAKAVGRDWGGAFDSFSQAFCITDENFHVILFNRSFQKLGENTKDLIGKNFFQFLSIPPNIPEKESVWLVKRKGDKADQRKDDQGKDDQGKDEFCLEISRKSLFLKRDKIQTFLFLVKDVTQERKLEDQLSHQAKERELGLIKAGIAHELNNPLSGIKILLNIMERKLSSHSPLCKDSLREMNEAVDRCSSLISDLLSVSSKIHWKQAGSKKKAF